MRTILAIARKDLSIHFTTPLAWVVFTGMSFLSAIFFLGSLQQFKQVQDMARALTWGRLGEGAAMFKNLTDGVAVPTFQTLLIITLFAVPFLSMGLFAQEKRQKTLELLLTLPVTPWQLVLGKYLAAVGIVGSALGLTIIYPVILAIFGSSESGAALEWSTVGLAYGGLLLFAVSCMSVGMFISSLTDSQILAAILTFAVLMGWLALALFSQFTEVQALKDFTHYASFTTQLENLMKGVLDPKAIVFFLSIIGLNLLFTQRAVEAQRWT